jgi:hypothetical protein
MIDTAVTPPLRQEKLSRSAQALALSVARRCSVEGSRPNGARPIAQMCSEPLTNVPGRFAITPRLGCVTTYQPERLQLA